MVQPREYRLDSRLDLAIVEKPPGLGVDVTLHRHLEAERVAMEPAALVPWRNMGEAVGRLEGEFLGEFDAHNLIVLYLAARRRATLLSESPLDFGDLVHQFLHVI